MPKLKNRRDIPTCGCISEEVQGDYPIKMKRCYVKVNLKNYYQEKTTKWIAIGWFCGNCGNVEIDIDQQEFRVKYCSQSSDYDPSFTNITHTRIL